ncbi:peptidylprolyl isomerase [Candidatus Pelagibacter bacterium nBUS_36]|uniref:peptidylprolyl isomerase n=1 Tax=Candidatus Pelagibacter bacterium nBUS_36 TaxID=3374194 RepID=UPI003EBEBF5B
MNINSIYIKFIKVIFIFLFYATNLIALENKIIVKVNNEIITSVDIENEINYLTILNPQVKNLEKKRVTNIAKNSLVREKVKIISLLDIFEEINVGNEYVDKIIKTTYEKNGFNTLDQYKEYLKKNRLKIEYIKNKISIEALWNELIYKKFNSKVVINKKKIINEVKNNPNIKILLSEIIFRIKNKKDLEKKYNEIKNDIQNDGFENAALIHSISNSASSGGAIGWIDKNSLNKVANNALLNLKIGEYSEPILTASGFLILKINDIKKNVSDEENLEKKVNTLIRIKTNQQLNQLSNIYLNKVKKDLTINEL